MSLQEASWISKGTEEIFEQIVKWRRHFHQNPELGFQEFETNKYIRSVLKEIGARDIKSIAGTGLTALIVSQKPGPVIAIRAEMDALPVEEKTGLEFASKNPGIMHACGHDAHMAIALGTAKLLHDHQDRWRGSVKFIFQPAEEYPPGGAVEMIKSGVLLEPQVEAALALHVSPSLPAGQIGYKDGVIMAADDLFKISIQGKSGHGALPHQAIDPIVLAAQVIMAIQTISSRKVNPLEPVVVTIGSIHGGVKANVIPEFITLDGTIRTLHDDLRQRMPELIKDTIKGIIESSGASFKLDYKWGYSPTVNNPQMVKLLAETVNKELGPACGKYLTNPFMIAEDFSFFTQQVPSVYFMLGIKKENNNQFPLHHAAFNIEESVMKNGIRVMTRTTVDYGNKVKL